MSAAPSLVTAVQTVSVEDAIEQIWERVLAGEFESPAEAVRAMWSSLVFSPDDLAFLALYGLGELARERQRKTRGSGREGRPAIGYGAPHGKKWDSYIGLTWAYDDAAGNPKSLLDFTDDDLALFAVKAGTLIDAYTRRRDWATATGELLKEHDVKRVRDLPAFVLRDVDAAAREAMGRQE